MFTADLDMFRMDSDIKVLKKEEPQTTSADYSYWLLADSVRLATKSAHHLANKILQEAIKDNPDPECSNYVSSDNRQLSADTTKEGSERKRVGVLGVIAQSSGSMDVQLQHTDGSYGERYTLDANVVSGAITPIQVLNMLRMAEWEQPINELLAAYKDVAVYLDEFPKADVEVFASIIQGAAGTFREAMEISDEKMRNALLLRPILRLQEANPSLMVDITKDINKLSNVDPRGNGENHAGWVYQLLKQVTTQLWALHQVTLLRAGMYVAQHEYAAGFAVLNDYSFFFDETIVPAIDMLAALQSHISQESELWREVQATDLSVPTPLSECMRLKTNHIVLEVFESSTRG